jgi:hypothetical protein
MSAIASTTTSSPKAGTLPRGSSRSSFQKRCARPSDRCAKTGLETKMDGQSNGKEAPWAFTKAVVDVGGY